MMQNTFDMKNIVNDFYSDNNVLSNKQILGFLDISKQEVLEQLINNFGLAKYLKAYEAGSIQTIHNAQEGYFVDEKFKERFERPYDHDDYSKGFNKLRKAKFNEDNSDHIKDDYTDQQLQKDGRVHIDHIRSAKSIHENDEARLYNTKDELNDIATNENNLAFTLYSINTSKGEKSMEEWLDIKRSDGSTNAEHYGINREKALELSKTAQDYINKAIHDKKMEYYSKEIKSQGFASGYALSKKMVVGFVLYELTEGLFKILRPLMNEWTELGSFKARKQRLVELTTDFIKNYNITSKFKKIAGTALNGFITGFTQIVFSLLVNSFISTVKVLGKIILAVLNTLVGVIKNIVSNIKKMTLQDALKHASKAILLAVFSVLTMMFTSQIELYISTHIPILTEYAETIALGITTLLAGLISALVIYVYNKYNEDVKYIIKLFTGKAFKEAEEKYQNFLKKLDEVYMLLKEELMDKYNIISNYMEKCGNLSLSSEKRFEASGKMATACEVKAPLCTIQDIDNYFTK